MARALSDSDALTYVAIGSFLVVLLSMLVMGGGNPMDLVFGVVNQLFEFYIFAGITYFVGKQFGGIGTFEDITYTFSLFYVPILLLLAADAGGGAAARSIRRR